MVVRISESAVENFTSSGSAIFYHAAETTVLSFDRTRFKANSQTVIHSQGTNNVAIRNCDGLAVEDFTSVSSLLRCDDLDAAEFCPADSCQDLSNALCRRDSQYIQVQSAKILHGCHAVSHFLALKKYIYARR